MTDKYAPTTEEVREFYGYGCGPEHSWRESWEDFDRWLAARDAEIAAKAFAQGVGRTLEVLGTATSPGDRLLTLIGNPYQKAVQS